MKNSSFMPTTDSGKLVWLNTFKNKIAAYAAQFNLSAAEVAQLAADCLMYAFVVNGLDLLKQSQQNFTAYKNLLNHAGGQTAATLPALPNLGTAPAAVAAGVFDRVRMMVQRIKNHPNYTEAIGQDLNIIAPIDTTDVNTICPVLNHKLDVGRPHLKWSKNIAEALDLYADHNDGNGFVLLGRFIRSEYLDTTTLAAGKIVDDWKYKAIFIIADEQVGLSSEIITVRTMKQ
jgi:hypothetical protein